MDSNVETDSPTKSFRYSVDQSTRPCKNINDLNDHYRHNSLMSNLQIINKLEQLFSKILKRDKKIHDLR